MKLKPKNRFNQLPEKTQSDLTAFATKELVEFVLNKMGADLDAMILFVLHEEYGFGKHKLRNVWDSVFKWKLKLRQQWEGSESDIADDARRVLKRIGVDVDLWEKEKQEWKPENDPVWQNYKH